VVEGDEPDDFSNSEAGQPSNANDPVDAAPPNQDAALDTARKGPELFFALVYPVGTDADLVVDVLSSALVNVDYHPEVVRLIDRLAPHTSQDVFTRYMQRMDDGNELRKRCNRADAFALFYASAMTGERAAVLPLKEVAARTQPRHAYIIRSLKRPEEVNTLRDMYGDALIVLAAHSPRQARSDRLTWQIARSSTEATSSESRRPQAEQLIARDEIESGDQQFGQQVSETFPMADMFVDASDRETLERSITRFIETLFGYPFHTPTRAEYGMFHAQGAALRSSDLSRQVGAAITNDDGEILALGTNEVPKAGGGLYWEDGVESDRRDFTYGYDVGRDIKQRALRQVLERLGQRRMLNEKPDALVAEAWTEVMGTDLVNVTEYGRGVHAEMAAIVDAARRGISIAGCTLYTTTFPCHVCARHIVSAGITNVVYNEPYPKSFARFLHLDSIAIDDPQAAEGRTRFVPFTGLAPHLYVRLFRMGRGSRQDRETGTVAKWDKTTAESQLIGDPAAYISREVAAFNVYTELNTADPGAGSANPASPAPAG
jgi:deoxycytidylate deaminase